jgi:hypothetical protein
VAIIRLLKENCYHGTRRFTNVVDKHCIWTIFQPNKIQLMSGKLNPSSPWSVSIRFSKENCAFVSCVCNLLAYLSVTGLLVLIMLWEQLSSVTCGHLKAETVFSDVSPCGRNVPTFRRNLLPPSNYTLKIKAADSWLFSGT